MTLVKRIGAAAAFAVTVVAGAVGTASPASAATYAGECGAGYSLLNSAAIGSKGTAFLAYSPATNLICMVVKRNTAGPPVLMEVGLSVPPTPPWEVIDNGLYRSYAGPIYLPAPDTCVDWMGRIAEEVRSGTFC